MQSSHQASCISKAGTGERAVLRRSIALRPNGPDLTIESAFYFHVQFSIDHQK